MDKAKSSEKVTLADVQSFAAENIVPARKNKIRCGDGRTTPEQSDGAIRAFGEDYGMMLAIKAAAWTHGEQNIDDGKLIDSYLDATSGERGENPRLFMHTDSHAVEHDGIGCGHARLSSSQDETGYILPSSEAARLYQAILARPEVDMQVLEGEHEEQAVLLVYSEKNEEGNRHSVNSKDKDGKISYFVVDMDGIRDHFELIVPQISKAIGIELTAQDAMTAYEKQQGESAQKLAFSKGLEAYKVNINNSGAASVGKI